MQQHASPDERTSDNVVKLEINCPVEQRRDGFEKKKKTDYKPFDFFVAV